MTCPNNFTKITLWKILIEPEWQYHSEWEYIASRLKYIASGSIINAGRFKFQRQRHIKRRMDGLPTLPTFGMTTAKEFRGAFNVTWLKQLSPVLPWCSSNCQPVLSGRWPASITINRNNFCTSLYVINHMTASKSRFHTKCALQWG